MTTPGVLQAAQAYDLISEPDEASRGVRDALASYSYASALATPQSHVQIPAREWRRLCTEALELLQGLLLLRRALIVLMQSTGTEALVLPFQALTAASLLPLRVVHDPARLAGVLQFLLPGEGLVVVEPGPTPGAGWDSEGQTEAERYRAVLAALRQGILNDAGRDTLLAHIDAALRT